MSKKQDQYLAKMAQRRESIIDSCKLFSMAFVAKKYKISRQRVRQIVQAASGKNETHSN